MNIFMRATSSSCSRLAWRSRSIRASRSTRYVAVVADVVGQRAQRQIGDARDDRVEEEAVVARRGSRRADTSRRYSSSQLRASRSRWLVGSSSSSRPGRPSSSLASAMRICQPPENVSVGRSKSSSREPEAAQHRRHLQLDAVAVAEAEPILQLAVAHEHRLVLVVGHRGVAEPLLERVHLGLHVQQRREREARLFEHACGPLCSRPSCGR